MPWVSSSLRAGAPWRLGRGAPHGEAGVRTRGLSATRRAAARGSRAPPTAAGRPQRPLPDKPACSRLLGCCCCVASVVTDSVRPHRRQPTRLPRPWDSPGKNTGVGCHFLLQRVKGKSEREVARLCPTLRDPMDCRPPGSSVHGIFQARVLEWGAIAL